MLYRGAGPALALCLVALGAPVMAQPGPAPCAGQPADGGQAVGKELELGWIIPANEDSGGGSAGDGIQVLEDGRIYQDQDWQAQDEEGLAQAFGLGTPPAGYRVAAGGTCALFAATLADLGPWAGRVARVTPASRFMVFLDPDRARVFAFHATQKKYLPVLWVERDGHWVAFHWRWSGGADGEAPALLAMEEAGRGLLFAGGAVQPQGSFHRVAPDDERIDFPGNPGRSECWADFYGKDPDSTGPGAGQADALQQRLAGLQQRSQARSGGPALFVPPGQETKAASGAGAGAGGDWGASARRLLVRAGDGLLDGAAAVHVGIQRLPVVGPVYGGGARLGEAISGQRVEYRSYADGPTVRTLSLEERSRAALDGTIATGMIVASAAVPGSSSLTASGLTASGGAPALQVAQVATVSNASVVGAGAAALLSVAGPGPGPGDGTNSESKQTESKTSEHAQRRAEEARAGDSHRQVGDTNRTVQEGRIFVDSETGHTVYVRGDRVVIRTADGRPVTQFKNPRANTQDRIQSGKWIPVPRS